LQNGLLALVTTNPTISAVLVAENVSSALRMIASHHPKLIILDMPNVGETIHDIKSHWPDIHLNVLADDILQQDEAEDSGADSVLIKGFHAQKLVDIVESVIANQADRTNENPMAIDK
jgi:DNA-binding NarL/FixJ family response regulator